MISKLTTPFPEFAKESTLYEVNLRQYSPGGTLREFKDHLPRLKEMGVGILWFMPIHPIGIDQRKGTLGSYYSIRDFRAIDDSYGTLSDFRELVKEIHNLGMKIILDWVANHTSWDNNLTIDHPDFFDRDEQGRFLPPFPEWEDVIHLNYSNPNLWDYMADAMKFWIKDTDIDGFRCDMAHLVPSEFWKFAIDQIREIKPVYMLAEAEDRNLLQAGFNTLYGWRIFHALNGIARGEQGLGVLDNLFTSEFYDFPSEANQMLFTSNHDENSWNGSAIERMGFAVESAIVLSFTLPGIPLIYSGQEAGNYKRLAFFDKDPIEWKEDKLFDLFSKLSRLKQRNPSLWNASFGGTLNRIHNTASDKIFSFVRGSNGNKVLILVNLSGEHLHFSLQNFPLNEEYKNALTGKCIFLAASASFSLKPFDYLILEK